MRGLAALTTLLLVFSAAAQTPPPVEDCDLTVHALEGMFVAQKASPDRGEYLDKDFRILFSVDEDGTRRAISTGGRVFPQLPLTEKYEYELREVRETPSGGDEAYYFADLAARHGFDEAELEEKKQENKNLGWKAEAMLYVRVDTKRCRLQVADMYATYLDGKRIEDFNMGGMSPYVRSDEPHYSMVSCPAATRRERPEENRQGELIPWPTSPTDVVRGQPFPASAQGARVPAGPPVYWVYEDPALNVDTAPPGCTYTLDAYLDDLPLEGLQGVPVPVGQALTHWSFETVHEPTTDKLFIEIHRHRVCDGRDEIIDAVCHVVSAGE